MCVTSVKSIKIRWPGHGNYSFMLTASFVEAGLDWPLGRMQVIWQHAVGPQLFGLEVRLWLSSPRNLYYFRAGESQLLVAPLWNILIPQSQLEGSYSVKSPFSPQWCLDLSLEVGEVIYNINEGSNLFHREDEKASGDHSRECSTACWEAEKRIRAKP